MSRLTLHQPKTGTTLQLENVTLALKINEDGVSVIHCQAEDQQAELWIDDLMLQNLALQCASFLPELAPQFALLQTEDPWCLPVGFIKTVDQESLRLLIGELDYEPGTFADFLGYLHDEAMTRHFLASMTQRAGAELLEEMAERWPGKAPEQAAAEEKRTGREAVQMVLRVLERLIYEGQVPDSMGLLDCPSQS